MSKTSRVSALIIVCAGLLPMAATAQELDFSDLSGDEMITQADGRIDQIEEHVGQVETLREETTFEEEDLQRLRCLNDNLAAMQGFLQLSSDAYGSLEDAVIGRDREGMEHQFSLVVIAAQRVTNLRNVASQCTSDILTYVGDTDLQVEIDEDIPDDGDLTQADDATTDLQGITGEGEPLPQSTPFQ